MKTVTSHRCLCRHYPTRGDAFGHHPSHEENNFSLFGGLEIRIANNINMFPWFARTISAFHFVQWLAQDRSKILPCWLRMRNFSANSDLSGGECGSRHFPNTGMKFNASQLKLAAHYFHPPFFPSVLATTEKVSSHVATRESGNISFRAAETFHFDQGLIFEVVGFGQNGAMKCFDADDDTGRWISRPFSAASVWLIASATLKTKALINYIWKISRDKSCAQSALDDLESLIALLRMLKAIAQKYKPCARRCFTGQPLQNYFSMGEMAGVDFRHGEIFGRGSGLSPVRLTVTVKSNRQPGIVFRRWPATPFRWVFPMPDFIDFFDLKNLRFFRFLIHRPLRRKIQK